MYRATFPSQWILAQVMSPGSQSQSHPHPYTLAAPYGWGCSELVPLVGVDGQRLSMGTALMSGQRPTYPPPGHDVGSTEPAQKKWQGYVKGGDDGNGDMSSSNGYYSGPGEQRRPPYRQQDHRTPEAEVRTNAGQAVGPPSKYVRRFPPPGREPASASLPYTTRMARCANRGVGYQKGVKRQLDMSSPQNSSSCSSTGSNDSLGVSTTKRKYMLPTVLPPPYCKPQARHDISVPKNVGNGGAWDKLSTQIWDRYMDSNQSDDVFERKMRLHEVLYRILHEHFPLCGLYVVGSSMTGFGCNTSDIDMCLMLQHNDIDQKLDALNILRMVLKALKRCDFVQKAELIRAKVPILKFSDSVSGIEVDLNINNSVGIRNTHLLNNYSKLDWRVRPLVVIVKAWARAHDINDAKNMTISSYSLALMVIHFLQCGAVPPVLPCLQRLFPHKFNHESNVHDLVLDEELTLAPMCNINTLGELFYGFLKYYARHFNFVEHAVSVRLGVKVPKTVVMYQRSPKNNPGQWKCLCVEEPFDLTNTARSVYDDHIFARVKQVFHWSCTRLEQTKELTSILNHKFTPS